jgi:DNA-nicking Smr family endonuclease
LTHRREESLPRPDTIEPRRLRRLSRGLLSDHIDLHGLNQDEARAELIAFVEDCIQRGVRGALIITGKGTLGDGVLRRRVPDWLAEPPLRPLIAGVSEAHRRHGGSGALYVALKRLKRT